MVFLSHTNTAILPEPYCGTITEPGLPVVEIEVEVEVFLKSPIPPPLKSQMVGPLEALCT